MSWREILGVSPTQNTHNTHNSQVENRSNNSAYYANSAEGFSKLMELIIPACFNLPTNAEQVISNLLSSEDEEDIINGLIPAETLRLHIELWVKQDMPYYSGKPVKTNGLEDSK